MRSKWSRYSCSSASRSPCCARSTSTRASIAPREPVVPAIPWIPILQGGVPTDARSVTRYLATAETDTSFARIALDVDDSRERDRVAPVLGLDLHRSARSAAVEGLLELVRDRRLDVRAHDLAAVEADLDPDPVLLSQRSPALREPRARTQDARKGPAYRTVPGAGRRRSRARLARPGRRDPAAGHPPRTRRGASQDRAWRGTCPRACRHPVRRATRLGSRPGVRQPPPPPATPACRAPRPSRRTAADTCR